MTIPSVEDLRRHLELAIQVELSTVPPYLYAMYSIEDQGSEAALLIRSVVVEEMLHAALMSNLLLAVGGDPDFRSPALMPVYPGLLPHHRPDLMLHLEPCSQRQIRDTFLVIEQPELRGAPPEDDDFETLGQFYHAVELSIGELARSQDLFARPQAERQLADPSFYQPVAFDAEDSGGLLLIDDFESARDAIEIVIHQGEGVSDERYADPSHQELTHYYKFLQIADGTSPLGTVRPAPTDPRTADYPEGLRQVSDLFNALYRYTYYTMDELFSPRPEKGEPVGHLYLLMSKLLSRVARYLMEQPVGDGMVAGPTFEIYEFGTDSPRDHLLDLADRVAADHTDLRELNGLISML